MQLRTNQSITASVFKTRQGSQQIITGIRKGLNETPDSMQFKFAPKQRKHLAKKSLTRVLSCIYFADLGITINTTFNLSSTCVVLAVVAGRQDWQPRLNSQQQKSLLLSQQLFSQRFSEESTLHDFTYRLWYSLRDAFQCIAQRNTTLLDCILYLMKYWSRHFTKLCELLYPWKRVLEIKSIKDGYWQDHWIWQVMTNRMCTWTCHVMLSNFEVSQAL